ncbi:alanine racemase [Salegentibacter sp. F188]|uniref:Alanine racemase n=1 Tax=Autumnicola patrickiae TaxID=3075591 RepID=A0ABU3E543_9FLAO|nr:alanine racemase [Salegentibacter sp. F188]MDT0690357.1 alanine racemase [Salegentibacter sp. F188]
MPKAQETVLEIDLGALAHNYKTIRSRVPEDVKFMAVIKAYAYGNDSINIARKLEDLGADYFAVAYIQEGVRLRQAGITTPIMIFHPQQENFDQLVENCLEPSLYSDHLLTDFIATAEKLGQKDYPVHIKFNTGMNRLGFSPKKVEVVFDRLATTSAVKVHSVFSHLAASEDWREREFTLNQINTFRKIAARFVEEFSYEPILHVCNTSAIFNYPEAAMSMVRCGIGLYGFGNDKEIDKKLKPVGTLKTLISQIQDLEEGETVGYNRTFKATRPSRIATLPLGYADGIHRKYGNEKTGVLVHGKFAPIVGNICMDILMIDVTDIDCEEGDQVVIFGERPHATDFAAAGNTISYELITGISQRVTRRIISE